MSLVWLEPFVGKKEEDSLSYFIFDNLNIMIVINTLSVLSFVFYYILYKLDNHLRRPPNNLVLLKFLSEALMSLHLLILFVSFKNESSSILGNSGNISNNNDNGSFNNTSDSNNNNNTSEDTTNSHSYLPNLNSNSLMYFISLLSPLTLFMVYYFNACIAQNLSITFVAYKNNYHKRIQYYKVFACIISFFLLTLAIFFNNNSNVSSIQFSVNFYSFFYIGLFYIFLILILIYIVLKIIFIIRNRNQFTSSVIKNQKELHAINSFIYQHTTFLLFFIICYLPNNVIQLSQIFMKEKIISINVDNRNPIYPVFIYLLSASGLISFLLKLNDPYMRKYFGVAFNLVTLRKSQNQLMDDINKPIEKYNDISKILFPEEDDSKAESFLNNEGSEMKTITIKNEDNNEDNSNIILISNNNNNENMSKVNKHLDFNTLSRDSNASKDSISKNMDLMANTFDNLNKTLSISDHLIRLIAMSICINKEDYLERNSNLIAESLPWGNDISDSQFKIKNTKKTNINKITYSDFYTEKSEFISYDNKNFPGYLNITPESDYYKSKVKIRSYSPVVFSHIRKIDNISNLDMIESLDYEKNSKHLEKMFAKGGRSANPILYTHDKKYLIKTISKEEKNILLNMLPLFHEKMGRVYSLLCRIYGMYRIKILNKVDAHIIIMKNMNELSDKSRIILFDLKGSTVDRNILSKGEVKYLNSLVESNTNISNNKSDKSNIQDDNESTTTITNNVNINNKNRKIKATELISKHSGKVFKDKDFTELGFKLKMTKSNAANLLDCLKEDTEVLKKYNCTDYSLLVSVHSKDEEDNSIYPPVRVINSTNGDLLYCFSLIDFLAEYNINKNIEKKFKLFAHYVKGDEDNNISAEEPCRYAERMCEFIENNCIDIIN